MPVVPSLIVGTVDLLLCPVALTPLNIAAAANFVLNADPTSRLSLSTAYTTRSLSSSPLTRRCHQQPQLHLQPPSERSVSIPPTVFNCSSALVSLKLLQRRHWSYQRLIYPMLSTEQFLGSKVTRNSKTNHRLAALLQISMLRSILTVHAERCYNRVQFLATRTSILRLQYRCPVLKNAIPTCLIAGLWLRPSIQPEARL
ncbi:hypothetical protein C8R43DRAFT_239616 [Mycena crocata]|nr:hypothetical protein C8R43DRAFT_239616 [Mycena crocata]